MQASSLELRSLHAQPVDQHTHHQGGFLLLGVTGAVLKELAVVVGLNGPSAHCKTELDVSLDLSGVGGSVEQPEFHGALGKESVEIDAVVSGRVVVLVVNGPGVTVICGAVPDTLSGFLALLAAGLHGLEQFGGDFVAPSVLSGTNLEGFVEQILSASGEVQQSGQAFGGVVGTINMDMDAAGSICHGSFLDQLPDDVLKILNVFVLKDGGDDLAGVVGTSALDSAVALDLAVDAAIAHGLPSAALMVGGTVDFVVGADVPGSGAEVFGDNLCGILPGDAGQLDFDSEVLIFDHHTNFLLSGYRW